MPKIAEIDGLRALVVLSSDGWRDEYLETISANGLSALSIRTSGEDLGFLRELPHLRGLVLNTDSVRDLNLVESLRELETLTLNTPKRPSVEVNFAALPNLRRLGIYWNNGFESVFSCRALEDLYVFDPPDADLKRFAHLRTLRRLELSEGRTLRNTRGIADLTDLRFLGLYHQSGLEALSGLDCVRSLRGVAIESCKRLNAIDEIASLDELRVLMVANCGEITTLRPLAGLQRLEQFLAWESTKIVDGDLSVLTRLPRLRQVAMMSRRGYQPTVSEVQAVLAERG